MATESTQARTARAILQAYNNWNIDEIVSYRTPDCIQEILPASLKRPLMGNAQYHAFFSAVLPKIKNFHVTIHDLIDDTTSKKVSIHASSTGDTELGVGAYSNEYMIVFEFDESGEKIKRMKEFVDSGKSKDQMAALMAGTGVSHVKAD